MASKKKTTKRSVDKKTSSTKPNLVCVEIGRGVYGLNVYLNGYRIVGEKPWGGGTVLKRVLVSEDDIKTAMDGYRVDPKKVELI